MENPKPGSKRNLVFGLALLISVAFCVALFFFGLIMRIEKEEALRHASDLQNEIIQLRRLVDACTEHAAFERARAEAAMAEAEKQLQLRNQNK